MLKDSPAARGGLQPGDYVLRVNNRAINGLKMPESRCRARSGDAIALGIHRSSGTTSGELSLTLTAVEGL